MIGTYTEENVKEFSALVPHTKKLNIISKFGLSKTHEIYFPKEDNNIIKLKKESTDQLYTTAQIKTNQGIKTVPKVNQVPESESQKVQSLEVKAKK